MRLNWVEKITSYFSIKGALYVVADSQGLLTQKEVHAALQKQNIFVATIEDPILLRLMYERNFRHVSKEKRATMLIVLPHQQFNLIPYDMYELAHRIALSSEMLFSKLEPTAVHLCPIAYYEILFSKQDSLTFQLTYKESLQFILEVILEEELRYILSDVGLIKIAMDYFKRFDMGLPELLINELSRTLQQKRIIVSPDVYECFKSKEKLSNFLNSRWKEYVAYYVKGNKEIISESPSSYSNRYFDDFSIRQQLNEWIEPIEIQADIPIEPWMKGNIVVKETSKQLNSISINSLKGDYSAFELKEWRAFANNLGDVKAKFLEDTVTSKEIKKITNEANKAFESWMFSKFEGIASLPLLPKPKMAHQIPHFLERKFKTKIALLVLDGMSFTQWHIMKKSLAEEQWLFEEDAVFTWVPSVTSVARQAIFSGKVPRDFTDSIQTTSKEEKYWKEFWIRHGFAERNIAYQKSLGLKSFDRQDLKFTSSPFISIYGAVIDVIDEFMHGAKQGHQTVNSELQIWLQKKFLHQLLDELASNDFDIYLTSDHGNIESIGLGRISQGVTVESANQRSRIYKSANIRNQTAIENPDTLIWDNVNLPNDYYVLLAKNNGAFVPKNDKIVTHGGIHIEEVIVPFVKVYR